MPSALNLIWLVIVLPVTFSEPIALEIVAGTGSYLGTQLFTGFMYIAAALCMLFLRGWKIGEVEEIARIKDQSVSGANATVGPLSDEDLARSVRIAGRKTIMSHFWKWRKV